MEYLRKLFDVTLVHTEVKDLDSEMQMNSGVGGSDMSLTRISATRPCFNVSQEHVNGRIHTKDLSEKQNNTNAWFKAKDEHELLHAIDVSYY